MAGRYVAALNDHFGIAIRRSLDLVYVAAAAMGGLCLISVLGLITVQAVARWMGIPIGGLTELATYGMAASLFLPLGYAFRAGAHIRVGLLLDRLSRKHRWIMELWCFSVASGLSTFLAWSAISMVTTSFVIGDTSPGADATPLWVPQLAMAFGTAIFALAILDEMILRVLAGKPADSWTPLARLAQAQPE